MKSANNERARASLRAFLESRGWTRNRLARMAGIEESVIRRFIKGNSASMTDKTWNILAKAAGEDPETLRNFIDKQESAPKMDPIIIPPPVAENVQPIVGVYALMWGRDMKKLYMGRTPTETKQAPPSLAAVQGGVFGVLVPDSTMEDRMEPDETAWVHPTRPPRVGKYCVFLGIEGPEGTPILIRKLIGITDTKWRVRQLNPRHDYDILRSEWPRACQIKHVEAT